MSSIATSRTSVETTTPAEPEDDGQSPVPCKKTHPSLFGNYKKMAHCSDQETDSVLFSFVTVATVKWGAVV